MVNRSFAGALYCYPRQRKVEAAGSGVVTVFVSGAGEIGGALAWLRGFGHGDFHGPGSRIRGRMPQHTDVRTPAQLSRAYAGGAASCDRHRSVVSDRAQWLDIAAGFALGHRLAGAPGCGAGPGPYASLMIEVIMS